MSSVNPYPPIVVPAIEEHQNPNANNTTCEIHFEKTETLYNEKEQANYLDRIKKILQQLIITPSQVGLKSLEKLSNKVIEAFTKAESPVSSPKQRGILSTITSYIFSPSSDPSSISDLNQYEKKSETNLKRVCSAIQATSLSEAPAQENISRIVSAVQGKIDWKIPNQEIADKKEELESSEKKPLEKNIDQKEEKSIDQKEEKNIDQEKLEKNIQEKLLENLKLIETDIAKKRNELKFNEQELSNKQLIFKKKIEQLRQIAPTETKKFMNQNMPDYEAVYDSNPSQVEIQQLKDKISEDKRELEKLSKEYYLPLILEKFSNQIPKKGTEERVEFEFDLLKCHFPEKSIEELAKIFEYQEFGENNLNPEEYIKAFIRAKYFILKDRNFDIDNQKFFNKEEKNLGITIGIASRKAAPVDNIATFITFFPSTYAEIKGKNKDDFYPFFRYSILTILHLTKKAGSITYARNFLISPGIEKAKFFKEIYTMALKRKDKELLLALELMGISYESTQKERENFILNDDKLKMQKMDNELVFSNWWTTDKDKLLYHLLKLENDQKKSLIEENNVPIIDLMINNWEEYYKHW